MRSRIMGTRVRVMSRLVAGALLAAACSDSALGPAFRPKPRGIALDAVATQGTGGLGENGTTLLARFNPNPHVGDAIVATFFWLGSSNIVTSVTDRLGNGTAVGNTYNLVEYVPSGGISMATYVATGAQNFPDTSSDPSGSNLLIVQANLSSSVTDGGVMLSAYSGVQPVYAQALNSNAHRSESGTGSTQTVTSHDSIPVTAGGLVYGVTMAMPPAPVGDPTGFTQVTNISDQNMKADGDYEVPPSAGYADPQWTWTFTAQSTWLTTALALNPSTSSGSGPGNLTVTTNTSGSNLPSGYTVTVDGSQSQPIGTSGSVTFTNLAAGSHSVALSGVPSNCVVAAPGSPRSVTVPAGGTAATTFTVGCSAATGAGIVLDQKDGTFSEQNVDSLVKGFNPTNPSLGDAIVATFYWVGSTNIIDSVTDVLTTSPSYTPVGNKYTLVDYHTAGGVSMATYLATNVQNFPGDSTPPNGNRILAVQAHLSQTVSDGGILISAYSGVALNYAQALGQVSAATGSGSSQTTADPGPIQVNAGALVYGATMSNGLVPLNGPEPAYTDLYTQSDGFIKGDGIYQVAAGAGSADPQWTWYFSAQSSWLATVLALNPGGSGNSTGNLTATTSTSGSNLPSGYTVTVDGGQSQSIGTNGSVTFTNLSAGSHSVALAVAGNCTVTGGNTQTVTVPSGGTATAAFTVTCSATTGNLTVTTSTSGSSLPSGYTVAVDGGQSQSIGTSGSVTFTNLTAGSHSVALTVAGNCTVTGGNTQTVSVPSGGTATTAFSVTCTTPPGNLTVTTSTSGSSLPSGYTVAVDGGQSQSIGTNGSVTFTNLAAGSHSVALTVAGNCTVSGGNTRSVTVPSGGTATTAFSVTCTTPPGNLTVSTSTSGSSLPSGYTVSLDNGAQTQAIGINSNVTFTNLAAGSHTVALTGVASNCTVSGGNTQTVTVPSGGTGTASFSVSCTTPPGNLTVSTSTAGSSLPSGYTVTVDGSQSQTIGVSGSVTFTNLSAGSHSVALKNVASNCTVTSANPQTATVPSGGTATTAFTVSCVRPPTPPVVNAGSNQTVVLGLLYTESATFSDAGNDGPWTYTIDWGDGTSGTWSASSQGSINETHTYLLLGAYTIKVTVTDSHGASGSASKVLTVIL